MDLLRCYVSVRMRFASLASETETHDLLPLMDGVSVGYTSTGIEREETTGILWRETETQGDIVRPFVHLPNHASKETLRPMRALPPVRENDGYAALLAEVDVAR